MTTVMKDPAGSKNSQWTLIGVGLAGLFSVMALVVSLFALAGRSDGGTVVAAPPAAMEHARTPSGRAVGGVGITFGDMWIKSTVASVKAGTVTFNVANQGQTMHGFASSPHPPRSAAGRSTRARSSPAATISRQAAPARSRPISSPAPTS
jgi:hypothetical protein